MARIIVVGARSPEAFGGGHIPGAPNVGLGPMFATWAGTVLPAGAAVLLVLDDPGGLWEATWQLLRAGYTPPAGWLAGGMRGWRTAHLPLETTEQLTVDELKDRLEAGQMRLLDVRQPAEWAVGHGAGRGHHRGAGGERGGAGRRPRLPGPGRGARLARHRQHPMARPHPGCHRAAVLALEHPRLRPVRAGLRPGGPGGRAAGHHHAADERAGTRLAGHPARRGAHHPRPGPSPARGGSAACTTPSTAGTGRRPGWAPRPSPAPGPGSNWTGTPGPASTRSVSAPPAGRATPSPAWCRGMIPAACTTPSSPTHRRGPPVLGPSPCGPLRGRSARFPRLFPVRPVPGLPSIIHLS